MRVIITGASGLIGTNLAVQLLSDGHHVFGVDKDPNPWVDNVPVHVQDLRDDCSNAAEAWGKADVVVHLAARAKVHESVERPANALENYTITYHVLEYCRATRTPIIFGSSRETYGEQQQVPVPEDAVRLEGAASPYAAAKMGEEALIRAYSRCYDLGMLIIRFSNVYGRYDDITRTGRFLPILFSRIPKGQPVPIFGAEKAYDFTYIDDAVAGLSAAVQRLVDAPQRVSGHAINLGTGEGTTLVEAARIVGRAAGVEPRLELQPTRVGEISRYVADIGKARRLLGYEPQYPPSVGIPLFFNWWREWYGRNTPPDPLAVAGAMAGIETEE
jgi:UDP-glucose 4-epimerase